MSAVRKPLAGFTNTADTSVAQESLSCGQLNWRQAVIYVTPHSVCQQSGLELVPARPLKGCTIARTVVLPQSSDSSLPSVPYAGRSGKNLRDAMPRRYNACAEQSGPQAISNSRLVCIDAEAARGVHPTNTQN